MADIIVHAGIDDELTPGLAKIGDEAKNTEAAIDGMSKTSVMGIGHMGHGFEGLVNTMQGGTPSIRTFFSAITSGMESAEAGTMAMTLGMGALVLGVMEGISKIQEFYSAKNETEKKSAEDEAAYEIKAQKIITDNYIENLRLRGEDALADKLEARNKEKESDADADKELQKTLAKNEALLDEAAKRQKELDDGVNTHRANMDTMWLSKHGKEVSNAIIEDGLAYDNYNAIVAGNAAKTSQIVINTDKNTAAERLKIKEAAADLEEKEKDSSR